MTYTVEPMSVARRPHATGVALASALLLAIDFTGCGSAGSADSARETRLQSAVRASVAHLADLEGDPTSNVTCVAASLSIMTCVGYHGTNSHTIYTATVEPATGRYLIASSTSKQLESGSVTDHPPSPVPGPRPTVRLDGVRVSGIGPHYQTLSHTMTLNGSVAPSNAPLTVSGVAATLATASYGYHPIKVSGGRFTLTLPVGAEENDFQILHGAEVIVTFTVTMT